MAGSRKLATIIVLFLAQYLQIQQLSRRQQQARIRCVLRGAQNAATVAHRRCRQHRMMIMVAMAIYYTVVHAFSSDIATSDNPQIAMPCVSTENLVLQQQQKPTPSTFPTRCRCHNTFLPWRCR